MIYNEAYVPIAGKAKPLGSEFMSVWSQGIQEQVDVDFKLSATLGYVRYRVPIDIHH